eukprot:CAMPEP_0119175534 /NCGR_PEP_ID=MMETSP1315-20130426/42421_1 /TAXON_ID=676789 /ORGANISM="Prasinoderma singularis, Strain RCC927" /LENGTH=388 /DNA_ID=CAMNT_0007169601 /DNA_START=9 /DNA_END=1175 /DNA_ORIENTATION=+
MVLEATMIALDNSEAMRNGDYAPTRFQAQADAVNLLCGAKTQANPENTVGVMTMGGANASVIVTPTADLGKILTALHGLPLEGKLNATGLQVAQLALKHRQNKNQRQRIVFFAGSLLEVETKALVKIGKKLKKNNVACDVIAFGETEENSEKLEAFITAVNSNDNSHLVTVPAGDQILSDVLITSPIMQGDGEGTSAFAAAAAAGSAAAAAGGLAGAEGLDQFGIDPSVDPELALALRVSMEEERARQERAAKEAEGGEGGEGGEGAAGEGGPSAAPADDAQPMEADEDALLQQALAMSMAGGDAMPAAAPAEAEEEVDDDLAKAMAMSVEGTGAAGASDAGTGGDLNDLVSGLPGVDVNDPALQAALAASLEEDMKDADAAEEKDSE